MLIDKSFSIKDGLLLHKNITPLAQTDIETLKEIEKLDVTGFTEADVRAEIIDPIVRVLGYKKGQYSSVDREKHISFLGKKSKYIDYNLTLWKENFWLIEAKKPLKGESFGYDELSQATEYSIHPEISASVIVLCDGKKLEVFDREENLETPVLAFKIKEIIDNIDSLRKILEPMQIWFFYKRRVIKSIDKAFELEFNLQRINEFKGIIERRINEKRGLIIKNFKSTQFMDNDPIADVEKATIDDIIDGYFFFLQPWPTTNAMNKKLIKSLLAGNAVNIIFKMFPHNHKGANDAYYANALRFLIELEDSSVRLDYIPSWLSCEQDKTVENLIKNLINKTLNYFQQDESIKSILLASACYRRLSKILTVVAPQIIENGEIHHLLTRFNESEFSWGQILSSPERHALINIDRMSLLATENFVKKFSTNDGGFKSSLAKQYLSQLWESEIFLLQEHPNYIQLLNDIDFGELYPTESSSIVYDFLGNACLCMINRSQKWKSYIIENHKAEITALAKCGSAEAIKILGAINNSEFVEGYNIELSKRFFFGEDETLKKLSDLYGLNVT